jgi:hypothetical protein
VAAIVPRVTEEPDFDRLGDPKNFKGAFGGEFSPGPV